MDDDDLVREQLSWLTPSVDLMAKQRDILKASRDQPPYLKAKLRKALSFMRE